MEDSYLITGGKKLEGAVSLSGAKNVALKTIIASLMFKNNVVLENIPRIKDVHELLNLINSLGAKADFIDKNTVEIDASGLNTSKVDFLHASKIRVSFMLFAPLLYRFGKCQIPNPGGCRIGARPIDRIVEGMKKLGISIDYDHKTGYYRAEMKNKPKGSYTFAKSSHTATEFLILLSLFGEGKITISNAANEPEIDNLVGFLNKSGAKIEKQGNTIAVTGVNELKSISPFRIMSDRNEAITYATLAICTKGKVIIKDLHKEQVTTFLAKLDEVGGGYEVANNEIAFFYKEPLKATDIETTPHPGFMTDWQPNWAIMMTQASGVSKIHERVFENRFSYVEELKKLGAEIEFVKNNVAKPEDFYFFNFDKNKQYLQEISIKGPKSLHGGVLTISDLRAGATLVIAALIAQGESVVNGVSILERGYENFVEKVKALGGAIQKV